METKVEFIAKPRLILRKICRSRLLNRLFQRLGEVGHSFGWLFLIDSETFEKKGYMCRFKGKST
jgi:hypothetical protein